MNAQILFDECYPHSHTLPKSEIIAFAEKYHEKRKEAYQKAKENFQSEQFISQHNFEEVRKRLNKNKD